MWSFQRWWAAGYLTAGFVLEEGLPFEVLDQVVEAMVRSVGEAEVQVMAGDTMVVERTRRMGSTLDHR